MFQNILSEKRVNLPYENAFKYNKRKDMAT
jgi:hypothetical protein